MTIAEARRQAFSILSTPFSSFVPVSTSPSLDILLLLSFFLDMTTTQLLSRPDTELGDMEKKFFEAVQSRHSGFPVAYITGSKDFWNLTFTVTPDVLIPKPDTEILVEKAISHIKKMQIAAAPVRVLDVCTGSGCVALSLKHSCPDIQITATDISKKALKIAAVNMARIFSLTDTDAELPVAFILNDLRDGLPSPESAGAQDNALYNLIVSNPPYVPTKMAQTLLNDGRREPLLALDGGEDGLALIRPLSHKARDKLTSGGVFLLETGEYNAKEAADYLNACGFLDIVIHTDLEGQDRVVEGIQP